MPRFRPRLAALAAAGAALALAVPALAATSSPSQTLVDHKINGPASAKAGAVTFKVKNTAKGLHELVVIKTTAKASKLKLKNGRASEAGSLGEVEVKGGAASKTLKLTLKPGHYVLICNVGSHYKAGMYKDFTVS